MPHDVVMTHVRAHLYDMSIRRLHLLGRDGDDVAAIRADSSGRRRGSGPGRASASLPSRPAACRASGSTRSIRPRTGSCSTSTAVVGSWGSPHSYRSLVADLAGAARIRGPHAGFPACAGAPLPRGAGRLRGRVRMAAHERDLPRPYRRRRRFLGRKPRDGARAALRDAGRPLPAGLVLLSPLMDLTLSGESHVSRRNLDPYFAGASLEPVIARYVPLGEALGPYLSPLQADLRGLPPMLVHVGDREIHAGRRAPDRRTRFRRRCRRPRGGLAGDDARLPGVRPVSPRRATGQQGDRRLHPDANRARLRRRRTP